MVVQGIIALALALPTGMLFGVGYGTGVRIGYEQVYPLLFPKDGDNRNVTPTVENIKRLNNIYDTIGGKEASQMGIANGLKDAMSELNKNPDFQDLVELESTLSGRIPSNLSPHNQTQADKQLEQIQISDFPSDSSLDPSSPNFNPELYVFVQKEKGNNPQTYAPPLPTQREKWEAMSISQLKLERNRRRHVPDKEAIQRIILRKTRQQLGTDAYTATFQEFNTKYLTMQQEYKELLLTYKALIGGKQVGRQSERHRILIRKAKGKVNAKVSQWYQFLAIEKSPKNRNSQTRLAAGRLYKQRLLKSVQ